MKRGETGVNSAHVQLSAPPSHLSPALLHWRMLILHPTVFRVYVEVFVSFVLFFFVCLLVFHENSQGIHRGGAWGGHFMVIMYLTSMLLNLTCKRLMSDVVIVLVIDRKTTTWPLGGLSPFPKPLCNPSHQLKVLFKHSLLWISVFNANTLSWDDLSMCRKHWVRLEKVLSKRCISQVTLRIPFWDYSRVRS